MGRKRSTKSHRFSEILWNKGAIKMNHPTTAMKHSYGRINVRGKKPKSIANLLVIGMTRRTLKHMHYRELFAQKKGV